VSEHRDKIPDVSNDPRISTPNSMQGKRWRPGSVNETLVENTAVAPSLLRLYWPFRPQGK
jgi:hypothetical protein